MRIFDLQISNSLKLPETVRSLCPYTPVENDKPGSGLRLHYQRQDQPAFHDG